MNTLSLLEERDRQKNAYEKLKANDFTQNY